MERVRVGDGVCDRVDVCRGEADRTGEVRGQ
jgi:hypothetical protein